MDTLLANILSALTVKSNGYPLLMNTDCGRSKHHSDEASKHDVLFLGGATILLRCSHRYS